MFESGNQTKNSLLLSPAQVGLKTDKVVKRAFGVVLPDLHDGVGTLSRAGIVQPDGTQRAETKRVAPARGDDFDRHAAFEVFRLPFEIMQRYPFGRDQSLVKRLILLFVHRAVDVIAALAVGIAVSAVRDGHVD